MSDPARDLLQRLESFAPLASSDELAALVAMRELVAAAEPFARTHFLPGHFTGSMFVIDRENYVLLVRHRKLGKWLQPGGHVDPGEDVFHAALRECMEETGVRPEEVESIPLDLDVHVIPERKNEPEHRHFDVRFLGIVPHRSTVKISDESDEVSWVPASKVRELTTEPSVLRPLEKILRRYC